MVLFMFCQACRPEAQESRTEDFSFSYVGNQYSGFLDLPAGTVRGIIILIPGSGPTDFLGTGGFAGFFKKKREAFQSLGFGVCAWDKAGCGASEGNFTEDLPVKSSVEEALVAIETLRQKGISGSDKIGLWGVSRGGWICPLIIEKDPGIAFWISVSGADQYDNFPYLLETNFRIEGRTEEEISVLMEEWDIRMKALRTGNLSYEEFLAATSHLYADPFYQSMGETSLSKEQFDYLVDYFQTSTDSFDVQTGIRILVPGFEQVLSRVHCPVLAIFGEKDSQIDWRKTRDLYQQTIGKQPSAELTILSLPNCNHLLMKCETGGKHENLEPFGYELCDEYYENMLSWLEARPD